MLFADAGDVSRGDPTCTQLPCSATWRFQYPQLSFGLGLRYRTLVGPLRLDAAIAPPGLQTFGSGDDRNPLRRAAVDLFGKSTARSASRSERRSDAAVAHRAARNGRARAVLAAARAALIASAALSLAAAAGAARGGELARRPGHARDPRRARDLALRTADAVRGRRARRDPVRRRRPAHRAREARRAAAGLERTWKQAPHGRRQRAARDARPCAWSTKATACRRSSPPSTREHPRRRAKPASRCTSLLTASRCEHDAARRPARPERLSRRGPARARPARHRREVSARIDHAHATMTQPFGYPADIDRLNGDLGAEGVMLHARAHRGKETRARTVSYAPPKDAPQAEPRLDVKVRARGVSVSTLARPGLRLGARTSRCRSPGSSSSKARRKTCRCKPRSTRSPGDADVQGSIASARGVSVTLPARGARAGAGFRRLPAASRRAARCASTRRLDAPVPLIHAEVEPLVYDTIAVPGFSLDGAIVAKGCASIA